MGIGGDCRLCRGFGRRTAAARAALTPAAEAQVGGAFSCLRVSTAHAIKGAVPLKVSHAHPLHYDVMARRDGRRISYGLAPRNLLSGLLLASFCHSLSARHECWSDGSVTFIILAEKMLPWPRLMPHAAAAALVLYGALVIASSQLHPIVKKDGSAAMPAEMQMTMPGMK